MRNVIHLLYCACHHWTGLIVVIFTWALSLIYFIDWTKGIPYAEPANTFMWIGLTIFLAFKFGEKGRKIYHDKKIFERWLEKMESNNISSDDKTKIAWQILRSKDLNTKAIDKIIQNTYPDSPIQNAALESRKILQEATIF